MSYTSRTTFGTHKDNITVFINNNGLFPNDAAATSVTGVVAKNGIPVVDITGAADTYEGVQGGDTFTVTGDGDLTLTNVVPLPYPGEYIIGTVNPGAPLYATIDLAANSHLFNTDTLTFGALRVVGAQGSSINMQATFIGSPIAVGPNGPVNGFFDNIVDATLGASDIHVESANLDIDQSAGANVRISLETYPSTLIYNAVTGQSYSANPAELNVALPAKFKGIVSFDRAGILELAGLKAISFDIKNDILRLFDTNKIVDAVKVSGITNGSVTVEQISGGIAVATNGEDGYQSGGVGTALKLHT